MLALISPSLITMPLAQKSIGAADRSLSIQITQSTAQIELLDSQISGKLVRVIYKMLKDDVEFNLD
ncbi:hypothetical protein [Mogibacterium pumilum]|uniref:Uncharacterized protein n=1 Tax=Mogibacterium pumilum TaxID=86332 RepID=A0A223ASD2_9FIRM|nr:hypothetical protein [Mogibacterium pumilum]ASS37898.1 hypothetical protein AXF17_05270 [Mogibacterium pumilum]